MKRRVCSIERAFFVFLILLTWKEQSSILIIKTTVNRREKGIASMKIIAFENKYRDDLIYI